MSANLQNDAGIVSLKFCQKRDDNCHGTTPSRVSRRGPWPAKLNSADLVQANWRSNLL